MANFEPVRIGFVGIGGIGQSHLEAAVKSGLLEVGALCDVKEPLLRERAEQLKVPAFTDFREMMRSADIEAVALILPHDLHLPACEAAFMAGLHVFLEKPPARNLKETRRIAEMAKESGKVWLLATNRRHSPCFSEVKRRLPEIGEVYLARFEYTSDPGRDIPFGWRGERKRAGGGALLDMGYHSVDLLVWFLGVPDRVLALSRMKGRPEIVYDTDDTADLLFEFEDGPIGHVTVSWAASPEEERCILCGTDGALLASWSEFLWLERGGRPAERLEGPKALWKEAFLRQIEHFAKCVRGLEEPLSPVASHVSNMAIMEAAYRSMETKRFETPKEFLEETNR